MSTEGLWIIGPESLFVAEDHVLALAEYLGGIASRCMHIAHSLSRLNPPADDPWASLDWAMVHRLRAEVEDCGERARAIARTLREYAADCARQERARVEYFHLPRDTAVATVVVSLSGGIPASASMPWGVKDAAASVLGGDYSPAPVAVWQLPGRRASVVQADTLEQRIRRIPSPAHPIRIERYEDQQGLVETEVFIAGTSDWGVGTTENPFDLESNLALVAGIPAASYLAVEMALRRSGVRPGDRVRFIGHSQGGLIAARLAESGRYETTGLLTAGAPLGSVSVHGRYPAVSLAHTDDLVPDLGGARSLTRSVGIERHSGSARGDFTGAHSLEAYARTAAAADASPARGHFGQWSGGGATSSPELFSARRASGD